MTKVVEAIYEKGIFRPVRKVSLPEHERFKLVISPVYEQRDKNNTEIKRLVKRQKRALLKVAGTASSGISDVSINHDKYLYSEPCGRE